MAHHLSTTHHSRAVLKWLVGLFVLACCVVSLLGPELAYANKVTCQSRLGRISCEVDIRDWIRQEIRDVLNNGWENTLHIDLILLGPKRDLVAVTYAEVSQRCYIDPFDNPCLVLWQGSTRWQSYEDVDEMIEGLGQFSLASVATKALQHGDYSMRVQIKLNPITDEQANVIRKWLSRSRGGHVVIGRSETSVFGTFVSVFANIRTGHSEARLILDSESFAVP